MIDNIPAEIALPLAAVLWGVFFIQTRHERIARRRLRRQK